ncbi:glyoxalase family protein [Paenibacillus turicensis]|uniref:Glyoxalase family protein n=1 Tax=Paenibacillus turicensis TaxID=160487 RepID=A0ABS4FV39_9BACL|nr:ring-cleaving dioxygenase [Paenibacillus turicensis]MBP1906440.1 glyoxalase family protein [Paenibacillus turicensis]
MQIKGIHHTSAFTASAAKNFHFYTEILGLRLVKKTVNQDNDSMYHLFYGDEAGSAGTEVTFFEIDHAGANRDGNNSISAVSLRVPSDDALTYWRDRFEQLDVPHEDIVQRGGRLTLAFKDFEGSRYILVSQQNDKAIQAVHGATTGKPWTAVVPEKYAIRGLGPVYLTVDNASATLSLMTEIMGFRQAGSYASFVPNQPDIIVLESGEGGAGTEIHIEERHDLPKERLGRGGVHHVAFRVEDGDEITAWANKLNEAGFSNTGLVDRYYFQSLYFREPNRILFEIATDGPGFTTDESLEQLGHTLALPPFLEPRRSQIEATLKPLLT